MISTKQCATVTPSLDAVPGGGTLSLVVLSDYEKLQMCAESWRELLTRSAADEPMLSPTWLLTWWRVYGKNHQLRVGMYFDDGRLVGISPLLLRRWWHRPGVPFERLQPLGADNDVSDGVCSEYLNLISESGYEHRVAEAFVQALTQNKFGVWDELVLPMMDARGLMPGLLRDLLQDAGIDTQLTAAETAHYAPLAGTWDDYLRQLGGRRRYYINRALRNFEYWAGADYEVREATTLAELAEGKAILARLHAERWQAAGKRGAFAAKNFQTFHDAVMPQLLEEGRLDLMWLNVRGEPVAVLYNIVANGKVYYYQAGRKISVPRGQRPGIVLFAHAIKKAISGGLWEFDFLAGGCQYKAKLAPAKRGLVHLRAVRSSIKEKLRRLTQRSVAWLKEALPR